MNTQESKDSLIGILSSIIIHALLFVATYFLIIKKHDLAPKENRKELSLGQFTKEVPQQPTPPIKQKPPVKQKKQKPQPKELVQKNNLAKTKAPDNNRTVKRVKEQIAENKAAPKNSLLSALNDKFKTVAKEKQEEIAADRSNGAKAGGAIRRLYGSEFERLSPEEQKFIKNNLGSIGRITEQHMYYPDVSYKMRQFGEGLFEFYLYPNGDISDLKQIFGTGYKALDNASKEALEIAYKDYPRPSVKTKIRILMGYIP